MRILLINPWIADFAAFDFWIKPLGLRYAGAFLRARGHDLRLIDCMDRFQPGSGVDPARDNRRFNTGKFHRTFIEKPSDLAHVPRNYSLYGIPRERFRELALDAPRPDVVLVTSVMTYWYPGVFEAIREIRYLLPGVPVVLGGIYATLCPEHARAHSGADAVCISGRPRDIVEIVERFGGSTGSSPVTADTFGEWPALPWDLYGGQKTATVMTTRGCPLACTVCASRVLFDGFERRSPDACADEILGLAARGVEDAAFADDALLLDAPRHAVPLFERLAAEGAPVRLHTPNGLHVREITSSLARLMRRAGVRTIRLSLETASKDRMEDFTGKVNQEDFCRAAGNLFDAGFPANELGAYVLAGLPGQTPAEVDETLTFAAACGVPVMPALYSPVPRTAEYVRALASGMIAPDSDPVIQNNTLRTVDWFAGYPGGYKGFKAKVEELFNTPHTFE
jgi:radical SAM superfamily enzyme YgiQ (UPF0313 family)